MKIQITGSRDWKDKEAIKEALLKYEATCIVEGECRGADSLSREVAKELGIEIKAYPADWKKYGKSAGPIRNREMFLNELDSDLVLAFHDNLDESKGTYDMVYGVCIPACKKVINVKHGDNKSLCYEEVKKI